ncbi:MAG: hypothetical protein V1663_00165 [archaeon]
MKIVFNIEKKHLYIFAAFLLLVGIGYVIASGTYNTGVYHASLLVDFLKSKTDASPITVEDDLKINDNNKLNIGPWWIRQDGGGNTPSYLHIGRFGGPSPGADTEFLKIDNSGNLIFIPSDNGGQFGIRNDGSSDKLKIGWICGGTSPPPECTGITGQITPKNIALSSNGDVQINGNLQVTGEISSNALSIYTNEYTWTQGDAAVVMINANQGVCFLTSVSGKFEGGGETVKVYIDTTSTPNRWFLSGSSNQQGVSAKARCLYTS